MPAGNVSSGQRNGAKGGCLSMIARIVGSWKTPKFATIRKLTAGGTSASDLEDSEEGKPQRARVAMTPWASLFSRLLRKLSLISSGNAARYLYSVRRLEDARKQRT